jgi:flagellar biosynthesis GTPase FlhF
MNSSHRQSGFSVVYVIVGVLLTAAVVGGIMMAQLRGRTVPTGSTIATNQGQNKQDTSGSGQSQSTTEKEKQTAAEKADAEKKAAEEKAAADKQAAEKKAADEKAAAAAKQQTTQSTPSTTAQSGNAASGSSAGSGPMARTATGSQMPTTGPTEDALGSAFGLIALVGAGYVYYTYGRRTA